MKIIADENIALLGHYFGSFGTIIQKPGRSITAADVKDADILLVRSVTKVDAELLANSTIKFVGSITTGIDHIDTTWLDQAKIKWAAASGCNANAVVEYVVCIIAALQKEGFLLKNNLRAGIIGVGRIGSMVNEKLKILGFETILCDPLKKEIVNTPLEKIEQLDFISCHTPLTTDGEYPTFHLIDRNFLQKQKKDCALLNTGRGGVIDSHDLKYYGQELIWCFDVWENEPFIDFSILENTFLATPHIAGYSVQAKTRGTQMIYHELQNWLSVSQNVSAPEEDRKLINCENKPMDWRDIVLNIFDPRKMTEQMQFIVPGGHDHFDWLRKNFINRYEFSAIDFNQPNVSADDKLLLEKLGVKLT